MTIEKKLGKVFVIAVILLVFLFLTISNTEAQVTLEKGGNVDIVMTKPSEKFDVPGTVKAKGFIVDGSQPPVGAILMYYGYFLDLPLNWRLCDGTKVIDPDSPLRGINLPDMRGRFPRGEYETGLDLASAGAKEGGDDTTPIHGHNLIGNGGHSHSFSSANTGDVSNSGSNPGGTTYLARDDNQGWTDNVHLAVDGGDSSKEGQHRHRLEGNLASASSHSHTVLGNPGIVNGNIPRYVGLHFIIRIK